MSKVHTTALRASAILWVIWGLVHALAGFIVVSSEATSAVQAIADAVPPAELSVSYPAAAAGVINQHGWNLAWFGIVTIVGAFFIWRGSVTAIWVTALVGGLADLGYLIFLDIPGFVKFMPGTLMTVVSGSAILLSFWVWWSRKNAQDRL